jgi:hypothetical protein
LIEVVRDECQLSVEELLQRILERVSTFSSGEQKDDLTLVVARGCLPANWEGLAETSDARRVADLRK